jgi:dihydroorotate dehydrogenase electron transfer subunit
MDMPSCATLSVLSLENNASGTAPGEAPGEADGELYTLRLERPGWKGWLPGQFVMLRREDPAADCLWARPFSIADVDSGSLRIVFQVAGRETAALSGLKKGDRLVVWGPLGNGFSLEAKTPTWLLAGGIGLAPFVGYIRRHPAPERLRLEFGHRLPLSCYPFAECAWPAGRLAAQSHLEACRADLEDFIRVLEAGIAEAAARHGLVLACGPLPFLRSVHRLALLYGARAELSLETRMACGIGACLGCVVKGRARPAPPRETPREFGFVQTCTAGPVFRAEDLEPEEDA